MSTKDKDMQIKGQSEGVIRNDNLDQHVKSNSQKVSVELESGKSAITMQGGSLVPIMYKEVLAGEYIEEWNINNLTRILTPKVPTMDKVFVNVQAYFVPHTRVWAGAERALANKTDADTKINSLPTMSIPATASQYSMFRFTLLSRYGIPNHAGALTINPLLLRGYRAIYNDFIRNKEYQAKLTEWNENTPTATETNHAIVYQANSINLIAGVNISNAYIPLQGQARKNYLTNVRKANPMENSTQDEREDISLHLDWQNRFKDEKQKLVNATKNDWDIIAEMGGTAPVRNDRVEFLGELDYELNFQQVSQTAPEINSSSPLGTTGSFSFTRADGTLFSHKKFLQHGFIHVLVSLNVEKLYEESIAKEFIKTSINDIYRPALAKKEIQMLNGKEVASNTSTPQSGVAFQPAWAEYKRLPNLVAGEMRSKLLTAVTGDDTFTPVSNSHWHNMVSKQNQVVINSGYFNDGQDVNKVLARNNLLNASLDPNGYFVVEPIMNMSEHFVKTQLPIESKVIPSVDIAEDTR